MAARLGCGVVKIRALSTLCLAVALAALGAPRAAGKAVHPGFFPVQPFRAHVRHVKVGDTQIAWYERGHGPPLVMLIGTGSTMSEWDPALLRLLAPQHRLLMLDYPGLGESGPWRGPRTFAGLANDVSRFMGAIGVRRADVLGWSMGGFVAQQLVIRHPGRLRRLVLAGTNPGGSRAVLGTKKEQEIDSAPDPTLAQILAELYPPHQLGEGFAFAHRLETASQSGEIPDDFHVPAATTDAQVAAENPWLRSNANFRELSSVSAPTLATGGRNDLVVPSLNLRRIAARVADGQLRLFAGRHAFLFQQRFAFAAVVDHFLAG
jgi:pimeloyl-ACP methyl ester carboxylesterase